MINIQICKYEVMNVDVLLATLVGAASQDPCTVKESTLKLTSLEQNSGYLSGLANVYRRAF